METNVSDFGSNRTYGVFLFSDLLLLTKPKTSRLAKTATPKHKFHTLYSLVELSPRDPDPSSRSLYISVKERIDDSAGIVMENNFRFIHHVEVGGAGAGGTNGRGREVVHEFMFESVRVKKEFGQKLLEMKKNAGKRVKSAEVL
jgi:hypothetical protein